MIKAGTDKGAEQSQQSANSDSSTSAVQLPVAPHKSARTTTGASKSERERVRKNKGAPKWLKNKPPRT
ncbi:hypothetical protein D3C76_1573410 [compost metagenome]